MEIKVGDRIKCSDYFNDISLTEGTVVSIAERGDNDPDDFDQYLVKVEGLKFGHGLGREHWWFKRSQITPITDNKKEAATKLPHNYTPILPTEESERNQIPLCEGCLDYFPLALAEVAKVSLIGNQQHNPGEPMGWARAKSTDHANKILKHLVDRGTNDIDGTRHSAKVAWRALALLEEELEAERGVRSRGSK